MYCLGYRPIWCQPMSAMQLPAALKHRLQPLAVQQTQQLQRRPARVLFTAFPFPDLDARCCVGLNASHAAPKKAASADGRALAACVTHTLKNGLNAVCRDGTG